MHKLTFSDYILESQTNESLKDKIKDTAIKAGRKLGIKKAKDADTSKEKEYKDALDDLLAELEDIVNNSIDDEEDVKTKKTDSGMSAIICYDPIAEDCDEENRKYTKLDYKKINKALKEVQQRHKCSVWITKHWWHNGARYLSVAFS